MNPNDRAPPPKDVTLPESFSLLSPIHVPSTDTSLEILFKCSIRQFTPSEYNLPIFEELMPPLIPFVLPFDSRPEVSDLVLNPPMFEVNAIDEATIDELQTSCYQAPMAMIRGLDKALGVDLLMFTTKSLVDLKPDHPVDVRTQYRMLSGINVDVSGKQTWQCPSVGGSTDVQRYAVYQDESYRQSMEQVSANASGSDGTTPVYTNPKAAATMMKAVKGPPANRLQSNGQATETGYKPTSVIEFGTNVDLSDEVLFASQLHELTKLPTFMRPSTSRNTLNHLGYNVLGMNTVQLYMKVAGCRTPGHLENNWFASVNLNIGPGDCEWFAVDNKHWPIIDEMCKERGIHLMKDAWWPNFDDLMSARVPVYRFVQKPGDIVWVDGGSVHWVQSVGCCNNVAWNVGPMTPEQNNLFSYEWNKVTKFQSLIPMQRLCWKLAANAEIDNPEMFTILKGVLIRSIAFCRMVYDHVYSITRELIPIQEPEDDEVAHFCDQCTVEVFNIIFTKMSRNKAVVHCAYCAKQTNFKNYTVVQEIAFEELSRILDNFRISSANPALLH